jgi:hypothetical protein
MSAARKNVECRMPNVELRNPVIQKAQVVQLFTTKSTKDTQIECQHVLFFFLNFVPFVVL